MSRSNDVTHGSSHGTVNDLQEAAVHQLQMAERYYTVYVVTYI